MREVPWGLTQTGCCMITWSGRLTLETVIGLSQLWRLLLVVQFTTVTVWTGQTWSRRKLLSPRTCTASLVLLETVWTLPGAGIQRLKSYLFRDSKKGTMIAAVAWTRLLVPLRMTQNCSWVGRWMLTLILWVYAAHNQQHFWNGCITMCAHRCVWRYLHLLTVVPYLNSWCEFQICEPITEGVNVKRFCLSFPCVLQRTVIALRPWL